MSGSLLSLELWKFFCCPALGFAACRSAQNAHIPSTLGMQINCLQQCQGKDHCAQQTPVASKQHAITRNKTAGPCMSTCHKCLSQTQWGVGKSYIIDLEGG